MVIVFLTKFNRLVEKLNDERNPYGSLVKTWQGERC